MFNLQTKLLQSEGILGQLALFEFNKDIEPIYYNAGTRGQTDILSFVSFLSTAACKNIRERWAFEGLCLLMFGKKKPGSNVPLLWTLRGNSIAAWMKRFLPYMCAVSFTDLLAYATNIQETTGAIAPPQFVAGLQLARDTKAGDTSVEQMLLIMYYLSNISVLHVNELTNTQAANKTYIATNAVTAIQMLGNSGTLGNPDTLLTKFRKIMGTEEDVLGDTIKEALEEKLFATITLTYDNGQFSASTKKIDIRDTKNFKFIPLRLMYQYCEGLLSTFSSNPYVGIECVLPSTGELVRYSVTANPDAYVQAYANCGDVDSARRRAGTPVGFSLKRGTIVLLNLESSVHSSSGVAHINPYMINRIGAITLKDIDTSIQGIDPASIKATFQSILSGKINTHRNAILQMLTHSDFDYARKRAGVYTQDDLASCNLAAVLVDIANHSHYKTLNTQMLAHPELFGDFSANLKTVTASVGMKTLVLHGKTLDARIEELKNLLTTNVVYIRYETKSGETSEVYATASEQLLAKALGDDYKLKFESKGIKYAETKRFILEKGIRDTATVAAFLEKYHIDLDASLLTGFTDADIQAWIDAKVASAKPRKAPTVAPEMIRVRNTRATSTGDYWKLINVNNIRGLAI